MNVPRKLGPLLVIFSVLMAACGTPSTGGTITGSPATSSSAASTAASGSPAATGDGTASSAAAPATGDMIDFRMAWWGSQNRHDRTIKVIDMFKQENPNVNITYEFSAFDDYWTKLTTQAAGRNVPCLIQQDYQKIGEWVSRGLLLPLDDYLANGTIDTTNIDDQYLEGGRLDGKVYAISMGTNSQTLIVDPAAFEKAGVAVPGNDWTWDEFEQTLTQVKDKTGTYGMSVGLDDNQVFKLWLKQHGKTLYNAEGNGLGYDDDQLYVEFFTMIKRFMDNGIIPNREFEVARGSQPIEADPIVTEQAAMATMWSNQIVAVATAANRPLETHLFPKLSTPNTQPGYYLKPSQFLSVTADCDQPEVAAKLINMFTNDLEANDVLAAERGVPISATVREYLQPKVEPAQQEAFELVSLVEQNGSPIDPPDPPKHSEVISDVYTPLMDQMLYGQLAPEDAAKQFREQASALLASN